MQALLKNPALPLLVIDLGRNKFREKGYESLSCLVKENKTLQTLCIRRNNEKMCVRRNNDTRMGNKGFETFSLALSKNKTLTDINLSCNQIGNEVAQSLVTMFSKNTTLLNINLSDNFICKEGQSVIREAIQKNPSIREVRGFRLTKKLKNSIVLENWRREIQQRREKLIFILEPCIKDVNVRRVILLLESFFPFPTLSNNIIQQNQ